VVFVGASLGICCFAAFFYLIDYASRLLRPISILAHVGHEGLAVIASVYPDPSPGPTSPGGIHKRQRPQRIISHQGTSGIVLAINIDAIKAEAERNNGVVEFVPQVGDFVSVDEPLFNLYGGASAIEDDILRSTLAFGSERTMEQDPTFAFRIVVDIALKALSPAINDPTTAVQALDQTEDLLLRIGQRRLDVGSLVGEHGYTRVTYPAPTWDDLLAVGLDEIRVYGASSLQVVRRLRLVLQHLEEAVTPDRRPAVRERIERLDVAIESEIAEIDRADALVGDPQGLGLSRAASESATA
jgi:uncharacterized membrane protein